ncbi:NUDIX hydrolase [Candidatus Saccharibacteria bacterium]|nr:NUDIX hydrolase [Candidatus Saccharibacteria bacterium]
MTEPKFAPKSGQVDYSSARYSPVVNAVVSKDDKILLVKRSPKMRFYPSYWNGISGFLDDDLDIAQKVIQELAEELGLNKSDILEIKKGTVFLQEAADYKKTWIVVPVLVRIKTGKFQLNSEASEANWFTPGEIGKLKLVPGFERVVGQFFST